MPSALTRRSFLASTSAAAVTAPLLTRLPRPPLAKKKILVLGGTNFLGPAIVNAGLARGHEFTLFNRGKTNPTLYANTPGVEQIRGQRRRPRPESALPPGRPKDPEQDLKALEGRKWDAVVDTSGFYTGEVEDVCKVLAGNAGQYVYVSSISVYKSLELEATPVDEQSPMWELKDKYVQSMGSNFENYGGLKRACEDTVSAAFPGHAALVRPGYIVGPDDDSDRFACWPARLMLGGECLAPGDPDNDLQFIDVRDLGEWIVHLVEQGTSGPFNAVGFDGGISTAEFLYTGKGTLNHQCTFTWVDDAFLEANGVQAWDTISCWTPRAKNGRCNNTKSIAAGAKYRPIADTIRDTAEWLRKVGNREWRKGVMTADRERELLAKWKAGARGK